MKKLILFFGISLFLVIGGIKLGVYLNTLVYIPGNMETNMVSLIEETKEIKLPGYWYKAYNPAVIPTDDGYQLVFRARSFGFWRFFFKTRLLGKREFFLCAVKLDKQFNVVSPITSIPMIAEWDGQDPRMIKIEDKTYLSFSFSPYPKSKEIYLHLAELVENNGEFTLENRVQLSFPESHKYKKENAFFSTVEKNWTPFSYQNELYFVYSITPMVVVKPDLKTGECTLVSESIQKDILYCSDLYNSATPPRGGTPVVKTDEGNLAFYHFLFCKGKSFTQKVVRLFTKNKKWLGNPKNIYFFNAYLFDDKPPFALKGILPFPVTGEGLYQNQRKIIYPTGLVKEGNTLLLFSGIDDKTMCVSKISLEKLNALLLEKPEEEKHSKKRYY